MSACRWWRRVEGGSLWDTAKKHGTKNEIKWVVNCMQQQQQQSQQGWDPRCTCGPDATSTFPPPVAATRRERDWGVQKMEAKSNASPTILRRQTSCRHNIHYKSTLSELDASRNPFFDADLQQELGALSCWPLVLLHQPGHGLLRRDRGASQGVRTRVGQGNDLFFKKKIHTGKKRSISLI